MTVADLRGRLACAAALALLAGCGGGGVPGASAPSRAASPTPVPAAGRVLAASDDGFTGRLAVGETALLRLTPETAPEPAESGGAVLLIRISYVTGTGRAEWEIRAVRAGTSRISVPRAGRAAAVLTFVVV